MRIVGPAIRAWALGVFAALPIALPAGAVAAEPPGPAPQAPRPVPEHLLAALRAKIPMSPIALQGDPYVAGQTKTQRPATAPVCGVRFESDQVHYRLSTFTSTAAARAAGFAVTHFGACGTCSTLQDLAVYLEKPDLTAPVRKCGVKWDAAARLRCLEDLGFSTPCAQTWLYDLENTRRQCLSVCVWSWIEEEPPTRKDGSLNACLQCDEDRSGPVFKVTAGRTRRNSGIRSSIPRPDEEIAPVVHDYIPDLGAQ
jgi:hypothetical protein